MKAQIITITPEKAEDLLLLNTTNRSLSKPHVMTLAREMTQGRWKFNGDAIRLHKNRLLDGQHRLHAVILSRVTIEALVIELDDPDVFDTIDVGKKRSAADTLSVQGEIETKKLAAALVVVDRYMTSRVMSCVRYTNTEIENLLKKYPAVRESIKKTRETKKLVPGSILTACHYLFSHKDNNAADQFVQDMIQGRNLLENDPVYILRERLLTNALAKAKLQAPYIMALIIKAWNARRSGREIKHLRFRQEGHATESFPVVQ